MSKSILETLLASATKAPARKRTAKRKAAPASSVEIPGLGNIPASTVKKWAPTIGGLLLGRALTRSSAKGGARKRRAAAPAKAPAADATAQTAPGNPWTKWLVLVFVVALVAWWLADGGLETLRRQSAPAEAPSAPAAPEKLVDGLWWEGRGVVAKVLPDDTAPPCHQRFFLRDDRGRSLFFAHNVDLAPRVPNLREGDELSFRGEWRDNDRGGAMHWTHHDPSGRPGGYLERGGVRYE